MRWLRSSTAAVVHGSFLLAVGLLASCVLAGEYGPNGDYPLALAVCTAAYPVTLLLVWAKAWVDGEIRRTMPGCASDGQRGHGDTKTLIAAASGSRGDS